MTIGLFSIICWYSFDDNRGERILVFETDIVLTNYRECLEEIFTIDTDDVCLSLDRSRDADTAGSYFCISSRNLYIAFEIGSNLGVIVILSCYEIGLLESIDKFTSENRGLAFPFAWKKSFVVGKFSREES